MTGILTRRVAAVGDDAFADLDLDGADGRLRAIDVRAADRPVRAGRPARAGGAAGERSSCRCERPIGDGDGSCLLCGREPAS